MRHSSTARFWRLYGELPAAAQRLADKNFELLKADPRHPSLHLKRIGELWSVRVGIHYRALAIAEEDGCVWFWIGSHENYDHLLP